MKREKQSCIFDDLSAEYYDLNLTPSGDQREAIVGGGREHCGPRYRVERNGFDFYVIEFIASGKGTLFIHSKTHPLCAGTLFLYGPNISHKIRTDSDEPLVKHYVIFAGSDLVRQVKATELFKKPRHTPYPARICSMFENLLAAGSEGGRHRNEICILQLKQLILSIDETALSQREMQLPSWQTYLRVVRYIEQHFPDIQNLDQVSEMCHTDKAYLCRLFKRYTDETPLHMLTRLKMRQAAERMLSDSGLPVKQAAEQAGYSDAGYFSRVFKRIFGVAPETYVKTFCRGA